MKGGSDRGRLCSFHAVAKDECRPGDQSVKICGTSSVKSVISLPFNCSSTNHGATRERSQTCRWHHQSERSVLVVSGRESEIRKQRMSCRDESADLQLGSWEAIGKRTVSSRAVCPTFLRSKKSSARHLEVCILVGSPLADTPSVSVGLFEVEVFHVLVR